MAGWRQAALGALPKSGFPWLTVPRILGALRIRVQLASQFLNVRPCPLAVTTLHQHAEGLQVIARVVPEARGALAFGGEGAEPWETADAPEPPEDGAFRYCPYCGAKLGDGFTFCSQCGKKLPDEP